MDYTSSNYYDFNLQPTVGKCWFHIFPSLGITKLLHICDLEPQLIIIYHGSEGWLSSAMSLSLRFCHVVAVSWHLDWSHLKVWVDWTSRLPYSHGGSCPPEWTIPCGLGFSQHKGCVLRECSKNQYVKSQKTARWVKGHTLEEAQYNFRRILLVKMVPTPSFLNEVIFVTLGQNSFTYIHMYRNRNLFIYIIHT